MQPHKETRSVPRIGHRIERVPQARERTRMIFKVDLKTPDIHRPRAIRQAQPHEARGIGGVRKPMPDPVGIDGKRPGMAAHP